MNLFVPMNVYPQLSLMRPNKDNNEVKFDVTK